MARRAKDSLKLGERDFDGHYVLRMVGLIRVMFLL